MSRHQIRSNQLITTFGPGAMVDLPDKSIIIAGLHKWNYQANKHCRVEEPRLAAKLARLLRDSGQGFKGQSIELRTPPPTIESLYQGGVVQPGVTGFVFPHWHIVQNVVLSPEKHRRRRLVHRDQLTDQGRFKEKDKSHSVVPVRFVRACRKGHVGDIQWRDFVHHGQIGCQQDLWIEERGTTGDLSDVWILCDCGAVRSMSDATERGNLGPCNGSRPWLDDTEGACGEPNHLLLRNASNAYFPQILPVISIPNGMSAVEAAVLANWDGFLCNIKTKEKLTEMRGMFAALNEALADLSDADVFSVMELLHEGKEPKAVAKPVKEIEFDALKGAPTAKQTDETDGDFLARGLDKTQWADPRLDGIEKVVQVHRLREVVALLGFTRLEPESADITGELALKVTRAPITRDPKWMPVVENRGEGIFLEFKPEAIEAWAKRDAVKARADELNASLEQWNRDHPHSTAEFPGVPYVMLHSLSHLLISAISLECGYPLSSLRERIYAPDGKGAMNENHGILIYTASAGSEGTLGGLVHAARDIRKHLLHALQLGTLCSNDPVCSTRGMHRGGVDRISGSACHGCLCISETSCERFNQFLDRSLVVPTIDGKGCEFFSI
jgi:hypothetical protein